MKPFMTITGIDSKITPEQVVQLSDAGAELGFLYTFERENRNRYIDKCWSAYTQLVLPTRASLHVCGRRAGTELLLRHYAPFEGLGNPYSNPICELGALGGQPNLLRNVQRIQVNGRYEVDQIEQICELYPYHVIITQHTQGNESLLKVRAPNHAILVDGSGGTGKSPDKWESPHTDKPVGFAGGLGPDNLASELPKIKAVAHRGWWIDMENKLRTEDWFDVAKALETIKIFNDNV